MRRVKVEITTDNPDDNGPATVTVETERGSGTTQDTKQVVPFDRLAKGLEFFLKEDQRLIVEPYAAEAIAYSPDQAAAYKVAEQEKLGEIDKPDMEPTPEGKAVWELERKRMEKDTGIKQPPMPGHPAAPGAPQPGHPSGVPNPPGGAIDSDQVAGRAPKGPLPDHPSLIQPRPEDLKREQAEREKKEKEEAVAKEKIDEERRRKEEALNKSKR